MSYAKRNDNLGWRSVSGPDDCGPDEAYSETQPVLEPQPEQILASLTQAMQAHLDAEAQTRRYDNIKSAALRAGYPGPFHDEGVAAATWMDTCFALGYTILAEVQAGTRSMPTEAELIALLPPMVWP